MVIPFHLSFNQYASVKMYERPAFSVRKFVGQAISAAVKHSSVSEEKPRTKREVRSHPLV